MRRSRTRVSACSGCSIPAMPAVSRLSIAPVKGLALEHPAEIELTDRASARIAASTWSTTPTGSSTGFSPGGWFRWRRTRTRTARNCACRFPTEHVIDEEVGLGGADVGRPSTGERGRACGHGTLGGPPLPSSSARSAHPLATGPGDAQAIRPADHGWLARGAWPPPCRCLVDGAALSDAHRARGRRGARGGRLGRPGVTIGGAVLLSRRWRAARSRHRTPTRACGTSTRSGRSSHTGA